MCLRPTKLRGPSSLPNNTSLSAYAALSALCSLASHSATKSATSHSRPDRLVLGRGPLRQFADDRQRVGLFVTGLHDHENPHEKNQGLQHLVDAEHMGNFAENRSQHPLHNEPRDEKVKTLKCVETDAAVVAEFMRGQ